MAVLIWILLAIGLAVGEMFAPALFLIMLAGGALAAAAAAGLGAGFAFQALVFAATSGLALFVLRPIAKQMQSNRTGPDADIGISALEGASALVLEDVDSDHGLVKLQGEEWTARPFDETQVIKSGERVNVVEIRGATAMVWRQE